MSKYIPNSFQTPNVLVDEIMPLLSEGELKVYLFAIRHVYGWQDKLEKGYAHISLSMFENGFSRFAGTGVSKPTITKALKELVRYKLLVKVPTSQTNVKGQAYAIGGEPNLEGLLSRKQKTKKKGVVKIVNQKGLNDLTGGSKDSLPNKIQVKKQVKLSASADVVKRNELFDWVVEHIFGVDPYINISRQTGARSGKSLQALKAIHTANNTELTLSHLEAFKGWYSQHYPEQTIPRTDTKLAEYYSEFYSWAKRRQEGVQSTPEYVTNDWMEVIEKFEEGK